MKKLIKLAKVFKDELKGKSVGVAIIAFILCLIVIALAYAASCLLTCGIVYLLTLCFGLEFSWPLGIGIWLVIMLLKNIFTVNVSSNK
jgi:hypothetical protein